jgi:hypothetical protein
MSETPQAGDDDQPERDGAPAPAEPAVTDPRIARAVGLLDTLGERPPAEHVEVYDEVHSVLQESLSEAQAGEDHGHGGAAP